MDTRSPLPVTSSNAGGLKPEAVSHYEWAMLALFSVAMAWSAIHPFDYFTWFLEVFPALLALIVIAATRRRFPLTNLLLTLIVLHAIVLMVGGHYTYAKVPWFDWIRDTFHQARNNYDRLGHFMQGFIPAMVAREVLLRKRVVRGKLWMFFIIVCICGAISAMYELFEWRVAVASGSAAGDFLGGQGDPWDTQEDMACAFIGAISAQLIMGRWHDRQLETCGFLPAQTD